MSAVVIEKKKKSRKLPKVITESQALSILNGINRKTISGCRHYAIIMTMYRSGLRVSEICDLRPESIFYDLRILFLQNAKGRKDRKVPLDDATIEALKAWDAIRPESEYFFCAYSKGKVGNQLSTRQVREMCYRTSYNAEVYIQDGDEKKKVSPHKYRHTAFTDLLNEGFNLREIQEIAGHESIESTQIYTHVAINGLVDKFRQRGLSRA